MYIRKWKTNGEFINQLTNLSTTQSGGTICSIPQVQKNTYATVCLKKIKLYLIKHLNVTTSLQEMQGLEEQVK